MKKIVLFSLNLIVVLSAFSQNFKGQWKGYFIDKSTPVGFGGEKCDYVLDLEAKGNKLTGFSYTYFSEGSKHYYTICRLEGVILPKQKYVEVREVERTKTNVPDSIRNCFQVHKLNYFKSKEGEILKGDWVPLPKQHGDCGFGVTQLNRRVLKSVIPTFNKGIAKSVPPAKKSVPLPARATVKPPTKLIAKIKPPVTEHLKADSLVTKIEPNKRENIVTREEPIPIPEEYQKRNFNLLKTIEVHHDIIRVDLYDNGEIDGDSISLFYNDKMILSNKKLSDKPITVLLNVDTETDVNELVMFAENLGLIPPNTALMVVTDGTNRYEVRITSDFKKSGVIRFVHRK